MVKRKRQTIQWPKKKDKKTRQYNGQRKKDKQYNNQKKQDKQYNNQKKKDKQYNDQKKQDKQYNNQKVKEEFEPNIIIAIIWMVMMFFSDEMSVMTPQ